MVDCWPACSEWCVCVNGKCEQSETKVNALRLRTPDGRYLQAVNGGPGGLRAATLPNPAQAATFLFTPLPAERPLTSGDAISLEVCDGNWISSGLLVRVDHNVRTFGRGKVRLVTYEVGGPGAGVWVREPWSAGYPAYPGNPPEERIFNIVKAGGGAIAHGDSVSLRINSNLGNTFFFRTTGAQDQAPVDGDGTTAGQAGTVFVVELNEVRAFLGWRPPTAPCQTCAAVQGKVKDQGSGQPIANASVAALTVVENHPFSATTTSDGTFTLSDPEGRTCVPAGNVRLRASANRHQTKTVGPVAVPATGSTNVEIALDCTQVKGRVVDDSAGNGVAGVTVFLLDSQDNALLDTNGNPYMATTRPDGSFLFDCVPHGPADVWTTAAPSQHRPIDVPPDGIANVTIVVQLTCGNVTGRVTDAGSGLPIAGATVNAVGTSFQATTDANGNFSIACVKPAGPRLITARAACHSSGSQSVNVPTMGNSSPVNLQLQPINPTEILITLDWGLQPSDLDAHLSGPDGQGGRFHLYYGNRSQPPVSYVSLDVDDSSGTGPENITIRRSPAMTGPFVAGEYRYWVHNYSKTTFNASSAVVTLMGTNGPTLCLLGRLEVAAATGMPDDDIWHVVDLLIDANGNVTQQVAQTLQQGIWSDEL